MTLAGAPGLGRRTLFEAVARGVAVAAAADGRPPIECGGATCRLRTLAFRASPLSADPTTPAARWNTGWRGWRGRSNRAAPSPLCVFLEEGEVAATFARFIAGAAPRRACWSWPPRARRWKPLSPPRWSCRRCDRRRRRADRRRPGTRPAPADVQRDPFGVQRQRGTDGRPDPPADRKCAAGATAALSLGRGHDLDALLAEGYAALPPAARRLMLAVALVGGAGQPDIRRVAGLDEEGAASAWADARRAGGFRPRPAVHRRCPARRTAGWSWRSGARRRPPWLRARWQRAGRFPRRAPPTRCWSPAARARRRRRCVKRRGAQPGIRRAPPICWGAPWRWGRWRCRLRSAWRRPLGSVRWAATRTPPRLFRRRGRPSTTAAEAVDLAEREAWLLARRGDLAGARATLERALAGADPAATRTLRARLARLLVTGGRYAEALAVVTPSLDRPGDDAAGVLAGEAALLANAYQGQVAAAAQQLAVVGPALGETRRVYLSGLLAQLAGEASSARDAYRVAFVQAAAADDIHTLASVALNLGGLLIDEGLYGEALTATARAVRELGRLGAQAELLPALINSANLLVSIGDLPAARRSLDRAAALARGSGAPAALATAAFVEGDLARRAGDAEVGPGPLRREPGRIRGRQRGRGGGRGRGGPRRGPGGARPLADATRRAGRGARARGARRRRPTDDSNLARAEALLALAHAPDVDADGAGRPAGAAGPRGRRSTAASDRLAAGGARGGRGGARRPERRRHARSRPPHLRGGSHGHPRASPRHVSTRTLTRAWLSPGGAAGAADGALAARAQAAEARLRRLLRINKRLNSELRLPRLLEMILDTVIELTDAERGFLLLEDDARRAAWSRSRATSTSRRWRRRSWRCRARSRARRPRAASRSSPSTPRATTASARRSRSRDLHLRSVLAVPLLVKGRAVGTIYVDHRLRKGAFDDDDVSLVSTSPSRPPSPSRTRACWPSCAGASARSRR